MSTLLRGVVVAGALGLVLAGCSDDSGQPRCGDGVISPEIGEQCEPGNLANWTCEDLGYRFGTLHCNPPGSANECRFDESGCYNSKCGNNTVEEGEQCDGYNLAGATCETLGFDGGMLRCKGPDSDEPCTYDVSDCKMSPFCGDQHADTDVGEECDGMDLAGQTCESLGFVGGMLACNLDCTFDTHGCIAPECGNGVREGDEVCDGTDLGGESCVTQGFIEGQLACQADCAGFDTSGCSGTPVCGNGVREGLEACDGTDLAGKSCADFGYLEGDLGCAPDCSDFDTSGCSGQTACQADAVLGTLQPDVPVHVATDLQGSQDHTTAGDCEPMFGGHGGDVVFLFTLPSDGTLTIDYTLGGTQQFPYVYALSHVGPGNCDSDVVQCDNVMSPSGTLSFDLSAGPYFFIWESFTQGLGGPVDFTFTFSVAEDCTNGTDDDGDGLADCADQEDCCGTAACSGDPACQGFDGSPCTEDASCTATGSFCLTEAADGLPGGVCSRTCTANSDCPTGLACVTFKNRDVCYPTCPSGTNDDCRAGYLCLDLSGVNICYPDCTSAADCPDTGTCNVYSGFCEPAKGLAADGEPCTAGSDCESGICIPESNGAPPGGYCVSVCNAADPWCPGDGVCVDYATTTAQNWYCFDGCSDSNECRTGYTCESNPFNPPPNDNICWYQ